MGVFRVCVMLCGGVRGYVRRVRSFVGRVYLELVFLCTSYLLPRVFF